MELVPDVLEQMKAAGIEDIPVIVGGIIPTRDAKLLMDMGVAMVFTPKDFSLTQAMAGIVRAIRDAHELV
jgi:(2R)-ethylmalonyl-CoA mutase